MTERPELHLVEDEDAGVCSVCGKPATTRSAIDSLPLCLSCFTETHWHPSWSKSFEPAEDE